MQVRVLHRALNQLNYEKTYNLSGGSGCHRGCDITVGNNSKTEAEKLVDIKEVAHLAAPQLADLHILKHKCGKICQMRKNSTDNIAKFSKGLEELGFEANDSLEINNALITSYEAIRQSIISGAIISMYRNHIIKLLEENVVIELKDRKL